MSDQESYVGQISALIPQVCYDIIGRVLPGMFLLVLAFLLFRDQDWTIGPSDMCFGNLYVPHGWFFLGALLISYMVGIILGAVGYLVVGREWSRPEQIRTPRSEIAEFPPHESYVYDVIQIHEPAAGARLVKLSAERNMCRVLTAGFLLLLVGSLLNRTGDWLVVSLLCIGIGSALIFHQHLGIRSRSLMRNLWYLLVTEGKVQLSSTKRSPRPSALDRESQTEPSSVGGQAKPANA